MVFECYQLILLASVYSETVLPVYYLQGFPLECIVDILLRWYFSMPLFQMVVIGLLGSAITQFKTYRCPRMRRHLGECSFTKNLSVVL